MLGSAPLVLAQIARWEVNFSLPRIRTTDPRNKEGSLG